MATARSSAALTASGSFLQQENNDTIYFSPYASFVATAFV